MSVQYQSFYAQRVKKELQAKDHFDKVVHIHNQMKMASSIGSNFSTASANKEIIRQRAFANQHSMQTNLKKPGRAPLYFVNSSNGLVPSDPNTLRDMGQVRNCVYSLEDATDNVARTVTWAELLQGDE